VLSRTKSIYLATRKRHDQLFNIYFMRPLAAGAVALLAPTRITPNQLTLTNLFVFVIAMALFVALPGYSGGVIGVLVLELSYLFDCADGMLARHKQIASKEGHLFDFFTDEIKAVLLVAALGLRFWRFGGYGPSVSPVGVAPMGGEPFLLATIFAVVVIASATSLTNFVRRPELTGKETPVSAHYENVQEAAPQSMPAWIAHQLMTFLRFLNHYPSHVWLFALAGRLDAFFWIYAGINALYLTRGWLALILRFGR
jgi:phosphatidylserine synthase